MDLNGVNRVKLSIQWLKNEPSDIFSHYLAASNFIVTKIIIDIVKTVEKILKKLNWKEFDNCTRLSKIIVQVSLI